jgi:pilus assembly protein CpaB
MEAAKRPKNGPLIVSLAIGALGAILLALYLHRFQAKARGGALIALLALRQDVAAGNPLREEMLVVHQVPESYIESRQVRAAEMHRVLGVRTAIDLETNQTLAWTDLSTTPRDHIPLSARVPAGMRALVIQQPRDRAFSALLTPGDRVDVLLTRQRSDSHGSAVTITLLQNVLVLAVGTRIDAAYPKADGSGREAVTLLLTVKQAALLTHAQRDGDLSLILRNADDLELLPDLPETDDSDVLVAERRAARQGRPLLERVH